MKTPLFFAFFLTLSTSFGQVSESFSDGNFTSSPAWSGNDTDYIVNPAFQLQLNSGGTDTSYLSTANIFSLNNCEWNFWIRLNFSPSASNNARFYLVSDQANLQGPLNGYFLQFGEALSNDQVELFRQSGTSTTSVCRGTTNISAAFAIRVKVIRDNAGLWTLLIDPSGGVNYVQEAQGTDVTFTTTSFLGLNCFYTSSNANDIYLDDLYCGAIIVDLAPPQVDSVAVNTLGQVEVFFSESVSLSSSQTLSNYQISNSVGAPLTATRDGSDFSKVTLTTTALPVNTLLTLTTNNVSDLLNNAMTLADVDTFYNSFPDYNDIVINELMPDPDPVVSLPNCEYIELYNRTNIPFYCRNYTITVGTNVQTLPDFEILADSFVLFTSTSCAPSFSGLHVLGVPSLPALLNAGTTITLKKSSGVVVTTLTYTDQWYQDVNKEDGGYSLEQIDPQMPCLGAVNWRASNDASGGTPGRTNSVNGVTVDNTFPLMQRAGIFSSTQLLVYFSEPIDSIGTLTTTPNLSVMGANFYSDDHSVILLSLGSSIQPLTEYTLTLSGYHSDCAGNTIPSSQTVKFGIAETLLPGDLILNEILPDPYDGNVEFVEVYNKSSKILDLNHLFLASQDTIANVLQSVNRVCSSSYVIFPGNFILLSINKNSVCNSYSCVPEGVYIDMNALPSLSNEGDIVVLADSLNTIIDRLVYTSDWHFSLLNDTKGVSLERINYVRPTQDAGNWHSAASTVNATPGKVNSQYSDNPSAGEISVVPEIFSPDNDGYNDVLTIHYTLDKAGFTGNVRIYDEKGRPVRKLVSNELLGTSGTITWDGINDSKEKALIGIYVIYFEVFHADGEVRKYKKVCVLGGKL